MSQILRDYEILLRLEKLQMHFLSTYLSNVKLIVCMLVCTYAYNLRSAESNQLKFSGHIRILFHKL